MNSKQKKDVVAIGKKSEAEEMQLPIERMMPPLFLFPDYGSIENKQACALCEYILHYIQETVSSPATEVINLKIIKFSERIYISLYKNQMQFITISGGSKKNS